MPVVKVSTKGQATLPKGLREEVGITAPGSVSVRVEDGHLVVEPVLSLAELRARYRDAFRGGPSLKQLQAEDKRAEQRRERRLEAMVRRSERRRR